MFYDIRVTRSLARVGVSRERGGEFFDDARYGTSRARVRALRFRKMCIVLC